MKRYFGILSFFLILPGISYAVPTCPLMCDRQWEQCKQTCTAGEDGRKCKSECSEQHESCLNACRQPQAEAPKKDKLSK